MMYLIFGAAVILPMALVLAGLLVWRGIYSLDRRRSPLNIQLMNLPGEGLRQRIAKHDEKFLEAATLMAVAGPFVLLMWLMARISRTGFDWKQLRLGPGDAVYAGMLVVVLAFVLWRLIHHAKARRRALEGLRAELAVAQCLTPLIAEGAMVFHDVPAQGYNLDHVVVARGAIFVVETKSRRKPAERGRASARVQYDGHQLFFPRHAEKAPIEQAAYQARWLDTYLREGGIENVRVIPVLALPGWYVEQTNREGRPNVLVNNCTNSTFMLHLSFGAALPDSTRKQVGQLIARRYPALQVPGA
jgi:hypothetical protein